MHAVGSIGRAISDDLASGSGTSARTVFHGQARIPLEVRTDPLTPGLLTAPRTSIPLSSDVEHSAEPGQSRL